MKITYLTAGAGGMYCGSCLRDNSLARFLHRAGVDIRLIPLYTPLRTDEEDVSENRLFFGGINMFLRQKSRVFRSLPQWTTRWLDHPRLVKLVASGRIETDGRQLGELTMAMLSGKEGPLGSEIERLVRWLESDPPDLINLSNLLIAGSIAELKRRLGLPILVTLQGDDLFLDQLPGEFRERAVDKLRELARDVDAFVVFSRFYAEKMAELLDVDLERFHQIPLGIDTTDFRSLNPEGRPDRPPTVGYLARVAPEKGLHRLARSFVELRKMPGMEETRLSIAGWNCHQANGYLREQLQFLAAAGAGQAVDLIGEVDREGKCRFLESIDLLCVPTEYAEPKGLFALEALAAGVPVVLPRHGAFPELGVESEAIHLVDVGNDSATATTLHRLLSDADGLRLLGVAGRRVVERKWSAEVMADHTIRLYDRFLDSKVLPPQEGKE